MGAGSLNCMIRICLALVLSACGVVASDWPEYRGAAGDGASSEALALNLPASGPKRIWRIDTPNGFSSFSIGGGKAFTVVTRQIEGTPAEVCLGVDADS